MVVAQFPQLRGISHAYVLSGKGARSSRPDPLTQQPEYAARFIAMFLALGPCDRANISARVYRRALLESVIQSAGLGAGSQWLFDPPTWTTPRVVGRTRANPKAQPSPEAHSFYRRSAKRKTDSKVLSAITIAEKYAGTPGEKLQWWRCGHPASATAYRLHRMLKEKLSWTASAWMILKETDNLAQLSQFRTAYRVPGGQCCLPINAVSKFSLMASHWQSNWRIQRRLPASPIACAAR